MNATSGLKACRACDRTLPLSEFFANRKSPDGRLWRCKRCDVASRRAARVQPLTVEAQARRSRAEAEALAVLQARPVKFCTQCAQEKPVDQFGRRRSSLNGLHQTCKSCRKHLRAEHYARERDRILAANAAWRLANPELLAEVNRNWSAANRVARTEAAGRRRARLRQSPVGPVDLEALWTGACGLCGLPIDRSLKHPDPASPSVDHILPVALGGSHEQANLQWTHLRCNLKKGTRPS